MKTAPALPPPEFEYERTRQFEEGDVPRVIEPGDGFRRLLLDQMVHDREHEHFQRQHHHRMHPRRLHKVCVVGDGQNGDGLG